MQLFYTPDHARVGDVIPYYENGEFKLFGILILEVIKRMDGIF